VVSAASDTAPVIIAALCAAGRAQAGKLLIATPAGGGVQDVSPAPCCHPTLSLDGRYLAFEKDGDVVLASLHDPRGTAVVLAPCLTAEPGLRTFAFDRTGDWIAIAIPEAVLVLPTSPSVGDGRRVALPSGARATDIVWSESGATLAVTACADDQTPVAIWLDVRSVQPLAVMSGSAVLAVPNDEVVWTVEPFEGRPAAQASMMERARFRQGVYLAPEDRMIVGWLPRRFEVVLSGFAEDAGDGADVVVAPIGGGELRPLIQGLQGVTTIVPTPDGQWVTALLADDPTAVHLFATGGGQAARVVMLPAPDDAGETGDPDADGADQPPSLVAEVACSGVVGTGTIGGPAWR